MVYWNIQFISRPYKNYDSLKYCLSIQTNFSYQLLQESYKNQMDYIDLTYFQQPFNFKYKHFIKSAVLSATLTVQFPKMRV